MFRVNQRFFVLNTAFLELLPQTHTDIHALFQPLPLSKVGIYAPLYSHYFGRKVGIRIRPLSATGVLWRVFIINQCTQKGKTFPRS